jgi:hypothetical protein
MKDGRIVRPHDIRLAFTMTNVHKDKQIDMWVNENEAVYAAVFPVTLAWFKSEGSNYLGNYWYYYDDDHAVFIHVYVVDTVMANRIKRRNTGFNGCDWMIDSIMKCKEIRKEFQSACR